MFCVVAVVYLIQWLLLIDCCSLGKTVSSMRLVASVCYPFSSFSGSIASMWCWRPLVMWRKGMDTALGCSHIFDVVFAGALACAQTMSTNATAITMPTNILGFFCQWIASAHWQIYGDTMIFDCERLRLRLTSSATDHRCSRQRKQARMDHCYSRQFLSSNWRQYRPSAMQSHFHRCLLQAMQSACYQHSCCSACQLFGTTYVIASTL